MQIKLKYLLSNFIICLMISYHIDHADSEYDNKNYYKLKICKLG